MRMITQFFVWVQLNRGVIMTVTKCWTDTFADSDGVDIVGAELRGI